MKAFIINLKNDIKRYERTKHELKKVGIKAKRFNAINGSNYKHDIQLQKNVTPFCKKFCNYKMIGCGLSHILLAQYLNKYNTNFNDDFYLIVEDDIKVFDLDIKNKINKIVNYYNTNFKSWDIILLFCQGLCFKNGTNKYNKLMGSTAAYLISKSGVEKMAKLQLSFHIDYIRNNKNFKVFNGPQLFTTFDDNNFTTFPKNIKVFNQTLGFWQSQTVIKIPGVDINISVITLVLIVVILLILFIYCRSGRK